MSITTTGISGGALTKQQVAFTHPTYAMLSPAWRQLQDIRWGNGGFLDGAYLVAHPREWQDFEAVTPRKPTKKLKARRAIASYENYAATIVSALKSALFREQPIRRLGDQPGPTEGTDGTIWDCWDNVDGAGTCIDDFITQVWDVAATFGHVHLYMDRMASSSAETAADQAMPILRAYSPLDALDWRVDDLGRLTAIKFAEIAPQPDITKVYVPQLRVRIVDQVGWKLYDSAGGLAEGGQGEHQMGMLPVVTLYATPQWEPGIGQTVLGDPKLYIDIYNLVSEVRELLRNQTFGILNIPLGTGPDALSVEQAMALIGNAKGSENALFSGTAAAFIQPDAANVTVYHAELARKLRSLYRLASVAWEADSLRAEAVGSMKLKREDMNQKLSGYADQCEKAEYWLANLFYRATFGADQGPNRLESDGLTIKYADNFDMTPFDVMLQEAQSALALAMPTAFLKELRKQLVRKFDGMSDLPDAKLKAIDDAIDNAPDDLTPDQRAQQNLKASVAALTFAQPGQPTKPQAVPKPAAGAAA